MEKIRGKKVLIVGLGKTGFALINLFNHFGCEIKVTELDNGYQIQVTGDEVKDRCKDLKDKCCDEKTVKKMISCCCDSDEC